MLVDALGHEVYHAGYFFDFGEEELFFDSMVLFKFVVPQSYQSEECFDILFRFDVRGLVVDCVLDE